MSEFGAKAALGVDESLNRCHVFARSEIETLQDARAMRVCNLVNLSTVCCFTTRVSAKSRGA